jgi:GT2 family glycosyltransferase
MKIGVAISNFENDDSVIELVSRILEEKWSIEGIIVVDSFGKGKIPEHIAANSLANISYHNFDENLGSAGNLRERLVLAAQKEWDYVLALNHDAMVQKSTFEALISYAGMENIGALYPLKYFPKKDFYDYSGMKEVGPWRSFGPKIPPKNQLLPYKWSSSNGALYSLEPSRLGILPNKDLWMGWEDYLYGLDLLKGGYKQFVVTDAVCEDNYEFEEKIFGGIKIQLSAKPSWYHYYRTRNLWLILCYHYPSPIRFLMIFSRTLLETIMIILGWEKTNKIESIKLQVIGLLHGIQNKKGKKLD